MDRFLRYVAVETTSDPESESFPSANCEFDLLKLLVKELQDLGIEAEMDQYGYVMATIPSNIVASLFGFKEEELFEMEEYKKENIEIEL